ncbi:MAG TPA: hypothetical protein VE133_16715, partial [Candidatus Sulfotelmatobacter sp.]|nr:hypothetical protein [Candidatus Sulfotelmatobacter sp.]
GEMAFSLRVGLWTKEKGTKNAFAFLLSQVRLCGRFAALKSVKMRQCALRVFEYLQCFII